MRSSIALSKMRPATIKVLVPQCCHVSRFYSRDSRISLALDPGYQASLDLSSI
jgi:hypothetical protein